MKKILAAVFVVALAGPAFAHQCPSLMKQIDEKLAAATMISDSDRAKVEELRATGEAEHAAGNHDASEAALNEALALLN